MNVPALQMQLREKAVHQAICKLSGGEQTIISALCLLFSIEKVLGEVCFLTPKGSLDKTGLERSVSRSLSRRLLLSVSFCALLLLK